MIIPDSNLRRLLVAVSVAAFLSAGCGDTTGETPAPAATATAPATTSTPATDTAPPPAADTAPPAATATEDTAAIDPTGPYFPTKPLPADFAELEHLLLATIDDNGAPAPLNGFLRPKKASAKDYVLVQPSLKGRDLTFTTAAVDGVSYSFTGTFQRAGHFAADPPEFDAVVLSGTLTKLRDGKSVATTPVDFAYQPGG